MNSQFRYIEDVPASEEQLAHIERILHQSVEDIAELADLVDDDSVDFREPADSGLEE